ncbi:WD40 repeat domain-containing protein, partial [Candidatus Venteria ishoeyi]
YSPDGGRIISGSGDNTLKIWDADTGVELHTLTGHTDWIIAVAYSPDGSRIVSGINNSTLKIWDANTGTELHTLTGHVGGLLAVAYSPDGNSIVSGSFDNTLKIWDANTGTQIHSFVGHTGIVSGVAFSPDGHRIYSGSYDRTIKVWDSGILPTFTLPATLDITLGTNQQIPLLTAGSVHSWLSSDETIATVDSNGMVTALKPGQVDISAVDINGLSTSTRITIFDQLSLSPDLRYAAPGSIVELQAEGGNGQYIWSTPAGNLQSDGANARFTVTEPGVFYIWVSDGQQFAWSVVDATQQDEVVLLRIVPETIQLTTQGQRGISVLGYTQHGQEINLSDVTQLNLSDSTFAQLDGTQLHAVAAGQTRLTAQYRHLNQYITVEIVPPTQILQTTPTALVINEGDSQPVEIYLRDQDGNKTPVYDALVTMADNHIANYSNGQVFGLQSGITQLLVQLGGISLPVSVTVRPTPPFAITPAQVVSDEATRLSFNLSGGQGPYELSASKGGLLQQVGNNYLYQAGGIGDVTLTAIDSLGTLSTAQLSIVPPLQVTPGQATLQAGETLQLNVSGGDGNYTWTATRGDLSSISGNHVTYTAPSGVGLHTVMVRDNLGLNLEIPVLVGDTLRLSPSLLFLKPNQQNTLTIVGGTPPFAVTTSAGQASIEGQSLIYIAPPVAGEYRLDLRDATGQNIQAHVTVSLDLLISPQELVLDANSTQKLNAIGGVGNLHWKATRGGFESSVEQGSENQVSYTAPAVFGPDTLLVYDAAGNVGTAQAHVTDSSIILSPTLRQLYPNASTHFSVIGGTAPYQWVVENGDISPNGDTSSATYTAPAQRGIYNLIVTDATQKQSRAQIQVYRKQLIASPQTLYLARGETASISFSAGSGGYTAWANFGAIELNDFENGRGTYTAPSHYEGLDTIYIQDSAGHVAVIRVEITRQDEILAMYTGPDGIVQDWEMEKALGDFFSGQPWLDRLVLYSLVEGVIAK